MWRACLVCMKLFFMQFLRAFDLCIRCSFGVFDLLIWNWYLIINFELNIASLTQTYLFVLKMSLPMSEADE